MSQPTLEVYRTIGPFDARSLPKGLLQEHRLKDGSWGRLTLLSGSIGFAWDDGNRELFLLEQGDTFLIPPQQPHHLEPHGPFELKIDFLRDALTVGA